MISWSRQQVPIYAVIAMFIVYKNRCSVIMFVWFDKWKYEMVTLNLATKDGSRFICGRLGGESMAQNRRFLEQLETAPLA